MGCSHPRSGSTITRAVEENATLAAQALKRPKTNLIRDPLEDRALSRLETICTEIRAFEPITIDVRVGWSYSRILVTV